MIIDCHAHLVPPELLDRDPQGRGEAFPACGRSKPTAASPWPSVVASRRDRYRSHSRTFPRGSPGWPNKASTNRSSAAGSICSAMSCPARRPKPGRGCQRLPAAPPPRPSRISCRWRRCRSRDGKRAAAVLKDAVKAGFAGAMIGTLPRGVGSTLDAADLDAFWQAADDTGCTHPYPSELRRRRRAGERFRPRQRARPHHRRGRRRGAADLGRARHEVRKCEILRADGRRRSALRARPPRAQLRRSRPASAIRSLRWPRSITDTILHDARV